MKTDKIIENLRTENMFTKIDDLKRNLVRNIGFKYIGKDRGVPYYDGGNGIYASVHCINGIKYHFELQPGIWTPGMILFDERY